MTYMSFSSYCTLSQGINTQQVLNGKLIKSSFKHENYLFPFDFNALS